MSWKVLLLLLGINFVYMCLGGLTFYLLEKSGEDDIRELTRSRKSTFLDRNPCVNYTELEAFITAILYAHDRGIEAVDNTSNPPNWNFPSALFFSGTVVTTIGYGYISPSTSEGRAFCVFYAIIGIPLMLVMLAGIGENLRSLTESLDLRLEICRESPGLRRAFRVCFIFGLGVLLFLFIPGVIFSHVEGWTYGESLYFSVITLTTIGFGDFVAGSGVTLKHGRAIYRLCIWCWIFIGLAWLASVISAIQDCVQDWTKKVERKAERSLRKSVNNTKVVSSSDKRNEAHELK